MSALVIAEHDNQTLAAKNAKLITAASQCDECVDVMVIGCDCHAVADQCAQLANVNKILYVDEATCAHPTAEMLTEIIARIASQYSHIIADSSTFGKNFMPRLAAKLNVAAVSDVITIHSATEFSRPIYAGNAIETIRVDQPIIPMTIRANRFAGVKKTNHAVNIERMSVEKYDSPVKFIQLEQHQSERPDLSAANIVVSGGRGLQSKEKFVLVEQLADALHAAIGASRAAVDAGFVPNDYQVGQTGKTVAPDLYIALGISGAIQHVAGIKDSKVIVAINQDPDAPIFDVADYGLVGDVFKLVPEMISQLKSR